MTDFEVNRQNMDGDGNASDMSQGMFACMDKFATTFEVSARRWELVVYPSLLAFIVLAAYGFFLIYTLTTDVGRLARSIETMVVSMDDIVADVHAVSTHVGRISSTMTLGAFACILAMRRKDGMVENINDLAGLSSSNPVMALFLTALMFSLAGIPPLAGFWGKWYVFLAAMEAQLYTLAVVGVLASVVGAFYYLRIIKIMWMDEPTTGSFMPMAGELRLVLGASGLFVIFYVLFGGTLLSTAETAARSFF